ncbi:SGNH/GDSL hydrolase family protein [uncultured Roseobacter sp.]|uniref:SGNH/GDSL hydrolase family protein n=1 Tax=uncultured Roseobacter sp. TaxID=114847 RepID=UPI00261FB3F1|nr:SGNH/GDSL hydrolase family protein [uncultured Roseobacter sp.]
MNRRQAIGLAGGALATGLTAGAGLTLRLHREPRRLPFLTDAHLATISPDPAGPPAILFIGNSMIMGHNVPSLVIERAAKDGIALQVGMAAAHGARLIETVRIDALRQVLSQNRWDALVLQDFTMTPLRVIDRWGSLLAMRRLAAWTGAPSVLLCPPWPARADASIYRDAGRAIVRPDDPSDYARRTMAYYNHAASQIGADVVNLPDTWRLAVEAGQPLYARDGHHASPDGASFAAEQVWTALSKHLI